MGGLAHNMEDPGAGRAGRANGFVPVVTRVLGGHLDEGPEYATFRRRGTTDWLLIHTVSGAGGFGDADGGVVRAGPGDAVLLRPRVLHDYATAPGSTGWEILFSHFHPRPEWMPLLAWPQPLPGIGRITADGEVHRRIVAALHRSARAGRGALARAELFAVNALEEALLWCDTQNHLGARTDERVLRVLDHVDAHLAEPLDVARLAEVVHLSTSRLTRLFREHLGTSPQRYVEQQRLIRAKQLLDLTDRPVGVIAREVGWEDPLYFSQRFARFAGQSPTAYRNRDQGETGFA
ncbi:AraC family transcriptional regulator of arabinose operon [Pseudonocardia kunmingensis]|uniref:AraC family transcriptional regulator of arabinose operon n=2 Tax=Pseudonocardia kunmingensis TaxID=630975 RepID=A0A543DQR3_9PSEU|nr:AraC family transcriptional regulator of arabinose operon [Pseudonocardia kunmingensis]